MPERVSFTYWSDPLCIWAYVSQDRLDRILALFTDHLDVTYRVVPVFGSVPWRFTEGPWASEGVHGRAEATRKVACRFGHDEVTGQCWVRSTPSSSWAPGAAIKAVCDMEAKGVVGPGCGAIYQHAIRRRFFVDEVNVALRANQLALAEDLGLPRGPIEQRLDDGSALAALWEDHREREEQRIQGSPTYVLDGGRARFYGNFTFDALRATFEALLSAGDPGGSRC